VLPNVYIEKPASPSASVRYRVGDETMVAPWSAVATAEPAGPLSAVSVFDTLAASFLVDEDAAIEWTPGGLDLFGRLAAVIEVVKGRVESEATRCATPYPFTLPPLSR
jgi:hypothetical protein